MPRTVSIDNVQVQRVVLSRDRDGNIRIHAEYDVRSGTQTIRQVVQEVTPRFSAARKAAAAAVLDGLSQDITATELA